MKSRGKTRGAESSNDQPARFQASMKVIDLLSADDRVAAVLAKHGLPCANCIVAEKETLEEGCRPLGLDPTPIIAELNTLPPR